MWVLSLLLVLFVLVSGCTGYTVTKETIDRGTEGPLEIGNQTHIPQENTTQTSPQAQNATPAQTDPCAGVVCPSNSTVCPDGASVSCSPACSQGACAPCMPDCSQHLCMESWACGNWSSCSGGQQTRTCTDQNNCGTTAVKPPETQGCVEDIFNVTIFFIEPAEEWVEIRNVGILTANLTNWTLRDNTTVSTHIFTFPSFTLSPGSWVRVHKGTQQNNQTDLYWGNNLNIWNNDGDVAYLSDALGNLMSMYVY